MPDQPPTSDPTTTPLRTPDKDVTASAGDVIANDPVPDRYHLSSSPYGFDEPGDPFHLEPADRQRMVESIAKRVEQWGLSVPAQFLFALMRPASVLMGNSVLLGSPFLDPVFGQDRRAVWQNFWNDRRNIDLLLRKIEEDVDEQVRKRQAEKAARRADKAAKES